MYEFLDRYKEKDKVIIALTGLLKDKYKLSDQKISQIIAEKTEIYLPISIFKTKLCALETLAIYLKDNLKIGFTKSAKLLNRSPKTLWGAYNRGKEKGWLVAAKDSKITIPLSAFSDRRKSTLEALVTHLKEDYKLSFTQISRLISRNVKTVWTTYKNGKRKE